MPNYSPRRENLEGVQACRKRLLVPICPLKEPKLLIGQEVGLLQSFSIYCREQKSISPEVNRNKIPQYTANSLTILTELPYHMTVVM